MPKWVSFSRDLVIYFEPPYECNIMVGFFFASHSLLLLAGSYFYVFSPPFFFVYFPFLTSPNLLFHFLKYFRISPYALTQ